MVEHRLVSCLDCLWSNKPSSNLLLYLIISWIITCLTFMLTFLIQFFHVMCQGNKQGWSTWLTSIFNIWHFLEGKKNYTWCSEIGDQWRKGRQVLKTDLVGVQELLVIVRHFDSFLCLQVECKLVLELLFSVMLITLIQVNLL